MIDEIIKNYEMVTFYKIMKMDLDLMKWSFTNITIADIEKCLEIKREADKLSIFINDKNDKLIETEKMMVNNYVHLNLVNEHENKTYASILNEIKDNLNLAIPRFNAELSKLRNVLAKVTPQYVIKDLKIDSIGKTEQLIKENEYFGVIQKYIDLKQDFDAKCVSFFSTQLFSKNYYDTMVQNSDELLLRKQEILQRSIQRYVESFSDEKQTVLYKALTAIDSKVSSESLELKSIEKLMEIDIIPYLNARYETKAALNYYMGEISSKEVIDDFEESYFGHLETDPNNHNVSYVAYKNKTEFLSYRKIVELETCKEIIEKNCNAAVQQISQIMDELNVSEEIELEESYRIRI